jgi:hypothetical protein
LWSAIVNNDTDPELWLDPVKEKLIGATVVKTIMFKTQTQDFSGLVISDHSL